MQGKNFIVDNKSNLKNDLVLLEQLQNLLNDNYDKYTIDNQAKRIIKIII